MKLNMPIVRSILKDDELAWSSLADSIIGWKFRIADDGMIKSYLFKLIWLGVEQEHVLQNNIIRHFQFQITPIPA